MRQFNFLRYQGTGRKLCAISYGEEGVRYTGIWRKSILGEAGTHNGNCSSSHCCGCLDQRAHEAWTLEITKEPSAIYTCRDGKTETINGALLCLNVSCPSYKNGVNIGNRDTQAAYTIVLNAAARIWVDSTLLPSERL